MPECWLNIYIKLNGPVSDMFTPLAQKTCPYGCHKYHVLMKWRKVCSQYSHHSRGQRLSWVALFQQQAHCHTPGPMVLSISWVCIKGYGCPGMVEEWFWWWLDFLNMLILWLIINTYQLQYNTLLDEYNMVCGMLLWIWLQYNMAKNIV